MSSDDLIRDIEADHVFMEIYEKCKPYTMTSIERAYALFESCKFIDKNQIEGDFVECGVWKGGSAMLIAYTLIKLKKIDRAIYLYDTFEGMTEPSDADYNLADKNDRAIDVWKRECEDNHNKWCFASLSEVEENMYSTGYPKEKIVFVKGKVEDTIPGNMSSEIALLRLDTDWYESTKHELEHLYPSLNNNGVLIIDDYGHWAGSKKAVDEYFYDKRMLLNRVDYTSRIGIKTSIL